jgi:uncharacterized protein (TIGR03083 family)
VERLTRHELLGRIRADRRHFEAILARVPRDRLEAPLLPGGWSVKDVLAHISWGEREAAGVVASRALVGSPLWNVSEDERNEAVVRESRPLTLDQVRREYEEAFEGYVTAVASLSDQELNDPDHIAGLAEEIPGWPPWRVLYDPTHYDEHGRTIEEHTIGQS